MKSNNAETVTFTPNLITATLFTTTSHELQITQFQLIQKSHASTLLAVFFGLVTTTKLLDTAFWWHNKTKLIYKII